MHTGTWILVGSMLALILTAFAYMAIRWIRAQTPWEKLSENFPDARYYGKDHKPDPQLLERCLHQTIQLLIKHSQLAVGLTGPAKWTAPKVAWALRDVRIYVMDSDKWVDEWGRTVAGIQADRNIIVGRNLASFLHECAHRCEQVIDNERDLTHATWVADGIRAAEDEFSVWLAAQRSGTT